MAAVSGRWRWEAFFRDSEITLTDMLELDRACAQSPNFIPTVFVMLQDDLPIGMIAICDDDLEGREALNPWLAGLYVQPDHRGQGYAVQLIAHLEQVAWQHGVEQLTLYTSEAVGLYSKLGWQIVERFDDQGKAFAIMRKRIGL